MSNSIDRTIGKYLNPKVLFGAGLFILIGGISTNTFFGRRGFLALETGKAKNLVISGNENNGLKETNADLGLTITLDSVRVHPHISQYEIEVLKKDTSSVNPHAQMGTSSKILIDRFSPEKMRIRKIENSDFLFRLKEFYPNFQFSYEYPSVRDTIEPRDPGITIELKTKEGTPITTLLDNPPARRTLGDVVSLGASLNYYRQIAADSIRRMADSGTTENRIIFSGADSIIYFMLNGMLNTQPLRENYFYAMPGKDSIGFTVMFSFPDAAYLKAVPSTSGNELLNPVAHVEIWKEGKGSMDAFVYPQTSVRKGGQFEIPGSDYSIGLGISKEQAKKYCDCSISILKKGSAEPESLLFAAGKARDYEGYRFIPQECKVGSPGLVTMEIQHLRGKNFILIGSILAGIAIILACLSKKTAPGIE